MRGGYLLRARNKPFEASVQSPSGSARNQCALFRRRPLARAAEEGHTTVLRMLLDGGAEVNAQGHLGFTPLIHNQAL